MALSLKKKTKDVTHNRRWWVVQGNNGKRLRDDQGAGISKQVLKTAIEYSHVYRFKGRWT